MLFFSEILWEGNSVRRLSEQHMQGKWVKTKPKPNKLKKPTNRPPCHPPPQNQGKILLIFSCSEELSSFSCTSPFQALLAWVIYLSHTGSCGAEVALWQAVVLFLPLDKYNLLPCLFPFASLVTEEMLRFIKADMPWEIPHTLSFTEPVHVDLWRHTGDFWLCIEQRLPNPLLGNTCGGKKNTNKTHPTCLLTCTKKRLS